MESQYTLSPCVTCFSNDSCSTCGSWARDELACQEQQVKEDEYLHQMCSFPVDALLLDWKLQKLVGRFRCPATKPSNRALAIETWT